MGSRVIVVDANILAYFFIEGTKSDLARRVWEKDNRWAAPELWRHEFINILVTNCLFAKLPQQTADRIWKDAVEMMRGNEYVSDMQQVLRLAAEKSVTSYDTEYALLAQSLGIPCVTEDGLLRKAFPATAVSMAAFLGAEDGPRAVRETASRYRAGRRR
jgi:predicted nucleic acid-binding protein